RIEDSSFTHSTWTHLGHVIQTKYHVLRRYCDRSAVCRVKNVLRTQHQHLSLQDSSIAKWQVNSHLVTVEVCVERSTGKRVQLNSLTFNELGLESLNTQTVQSWSTVQQNRVCFQHIFKDSPYDGMLTVYNLLCRFYSRDNTTLNKLPDKERLIKLSSHILRKTTFMHLYCWTNNDNRTCRIVNALTQQVLTETTLLTFQAVRK